LSPDPSPNAILSVLGRMLTTPARWHKESNTLEQMIRFFCVYDDELVRDVTLVLERRAGHSISELNAWGTPYAMECLFLDGLVSVARNWPLKPGDLNPLTGELIPMAKPKAEVASKKGAPRGMAKEPSLERTAAKKSLAKHGKVSK